MMFRKSWAKPLTREQISRLRGGEKHNFHYFVGILETPESDLVIDVLDVRLRTQKATQRPPSFPAGFEPFQTCFGTEILDLMTMKLPVPRIRLYAALPNPNIEKTRMASCVLNPSQNTEAFQVLTMAAEAFRTKCRIRTHAAKSRAKLDIVLSLMAHDEKRPPLVTDPAERFEAYLWSRTPEFLQNLLGLLDMEDAPGPITLERLRAA